MLTPADLQAFMHRHDMVGEVLILDTPTPTVEAAAAAVGTHLENIVKSVLFTIGSRRVLAVTCGTKPIERRAIAARYGVGRKRVKLAPPETVLAVTGYPVGTVPPFGHLTHLETLIDPRVLEQEQVFAGGGGYNALVRLDPADIQRISRGQVLDLHTRPREVS
jgi:prolyl-tRNA editing enzyme YbaK/EbsC (Cys-tRNA(Pro) deacylase)